MYYFVRRQKKQLFRVFYFEMMYMFNSRTGYNHMPQLLDTQQLRHFFCLQLSYWLSYICIMPTINTNSKKPSWVSERPSQERRKEDDQKFYNSRPWRRTSKRYRIQNPLCAECERNGLVTSADCVDHIRPIQQGGAKWNWDNLQSLCHSCHAKKSGKEAHK